MSDTLPEYYFRVKDGGCTVFRIDPDGPQRRLEMEPIASVNLGRGIYNPLGGRELIKADKVAIRQWMRSRRAVETMRQIDDVHRLVDHMNRTAHWAQGPAEDVQLDEVTEALLMAMHDLRNVLVRRKADRLTKS